MRSVSAIAIDLPEGSTKPSEFSELLARLEQILDDASSGRDGQPRLVPMRVVITFAADVPQLSEHAASMLLPDALDQFPPEQLERASDRAMTRARRDDTGMFTIIDETQTASSLAPAPARDVVRSGGDVDHFEASPDLHDIPPKTPTRADRLVDGARRGLRDLTATMMTRSRRGLAVIKAVIRNVMVAVHRVRSLRSAATLLLRSLWAPCVAAALVGIQAGGSPIAPALTAHVPVAGAAQAVSVPDPAPALPTVSRIGPASIPVLAAAIEPVQSAPVVEKPAAVPKAAPRAMPVQSLSARSVQSAARSTDGPPAIAAMTGSLVIESEPSGAQVFMNQRPVGVSPVVLSDVRAGAYAIQIQADGYSRWSRGIYVVVNQRTLVVAQLERERR